MCIINLFITRLNAFKFQQKHAKVSLTASAMGSIRVPTTPVYQELTFKTHQVFMIIQGVPH